MTVEGEMLRSAGQPVSSEQLLSEVRECLVEVIGEDYLLDCSIEMDTGFESDLQLESVEFVALAEALQGRYPAVDFVDWIAEMEVQQLMELKVGQLVEFIAQCLS